MLVLAKSLKGRDFYYSPRSAHRVSKRSANTIAGILNEKVNVVDNFEWTTHEVGCLSEAYAWAEIQAFVIRKGIVSEKRGRV